METKEYYLGLDMGTSSVGWAVTDENYNLIRIKGKDFWGIREFERASNAADRRTKRISRRRRQREVVRIGLLKTYFEEEILKEDPLFYIRMDNSKYFPEDKDGNLESKNGIFNDSDYTDKEYYADYPTIFHLRKALIEDSVPHDRRYARLVFLALLNLFKHRGHFLNANLGEREGNTRIEELYSEFVRLADNLLDLGFPPEAAKYVEEILSDRSKSRTEKSEEIAKKCNINKSNKKHILLIRCLCGLKVDVKKIFDDIESEEKIEIDFNDYSYDEKIDDFIAFIGEDNYELIEIMKQIYDAGILANILHGYEYLSFSRVAEYDKHHDDLKLLKEVYKEYKKEEYDQMFRMEESGSYSAYVNSFNTRKYNENGKPMRRSMKKRLREDLYKNIRKSLKGIEDERVNYILSEMERETFLPKQRTPGNGIIPNQVHKKELSAILKKAEQYLPFLQKKDESGLSVSERIEKLFAFQIPYYIGPTSKKSKTGWVIRKENGEILPWNIQDKIDMEKTAEEFIKRLVRNCTYINGEKVLPKNSLMYEAFCVLNEINNIKIQGEKISVELKQKIYKELFCKGKKVTKKQLEKYLVNEGVLLDVSDLSGLDININNSLSSYGKLYAIFGEKLKTDQYMKYAEKIIYLGTIYGDDKKMQKKRLKKEFGEILDEAQIKRIVGYKFKDWGRFSEELMELSGCDKSTGEIKSLIRTMWDTNDNFMELIHSNQYTFKEELAKKQNKSMGLLSEFQAEDLEDYYFSAPVKRMIWQTILVIKEIEKIMGNPPTRIFIEMTRDDEEVKGDKGRKDSRGKQLVNLYKNIKGETREWEKEIKAAQDDQSLRSKKLYLYYTQMGRCMYTGKEIDLEELFTTKYDIDHIYPRHFVKDDNLSNNLVLVNKSSNAYKSDHYPLTDIPADVQNLWRRLYDAGLIQREKYHRLTRKTSFSDEEKAGFIARQLVETSQGTKGIADLLKQLLPEPDTTIVYAKGRNVSDFRREFDLLKSRSVNDFHHAQDAYLNIVVGNVYYTKFTQNPMNYIKKELSANGNKYRYHLGKMFERDVERNGKKAWIAPNKKDGTNGTIVTVKKVMEKNTPMISRMTFEAKGAIANETLYSAKKAKKDNYIPLKSSDKKMEDVTKYGGYTSVSSAYFFLVEHEEKGKKIRTLEALPIYMKDKVEAKEDGLTEYCTDILKLINPVICMKKIKIQSLLCIDGFRVRLSGKTGYQIALRNEISLCLKQKWINYIHAIDKFIETKQLPQVIEEDKNVELYEILMDKHINSIFRKRQNSVGKKLEAGFEKYRNLSLEDQCKVLSEILKLSAIGLTKADLLQIGGKLESGTMSFNKKISKAEEFKLINQSVTGIYENSIDLLTI